MSNVTAAQLSSVNVIVFVGSVDGVLTAAALKRYAAEGCVLVACQAMTVDKINMSAWPENSNVMFVDLAVNNQKDRQTGKETGFQMTVDFVHKIYDLGHRIVGICDEHDANDWARVFEATGINAEMLLIKPVTKKDGPIKSSGALLAASVSDLDFHARLLCLMADAADNTEVYMIAKIADKAMKADMFNDRRRVHIVEHLSKNLEPSQEMLEWQIEYEVIEANNAAVIAEATNEAGMVIAQVRGRKINATAVFAALYQPDVVLVALVETEFFNPAAKQTILGTSVGVNNKVAPQFDIKAQLIQRGVAASGFNLKANVLPEDSENAVAAAREAVADYLAS